ncbi:hypothetical protein I79_010805 [Cricetulus griseus]|uniref:Uncharacterized protein n=1 Tax=Cricetulus griseus TaxID=10029 RepID=G3HJG0_CRIGR|nr:hypothetical protein I79_010805 [Cricetulus griseus]
MTTTTRAQCGSGAFFVCGSRPRLLLGEVLRDTFPPQLYLTLALPNRRLYPQSLTAGSPLL